MQQLCHPGQHKALPDHPQHHYSSLNFSLNNSNTDTISPSLTLHQLLSKYIHQFTTITHSITRLLIILTQAPNIIQLQSIQSFALKLNNSIYNTGQYRQYHAMIRQSTQDNSINNNNNAANISNNNGVSVNTLRRFSCRIMESLLAFKQKVESSTCLELAQGLVGKLQRQISKLQDWNNLGQFICGVWMCLKQFQENVKLNYKNKINGNNHKNNTNNGKGNTDKFSTQRDIGKAHQPSAGNKQKLTSLISTSTTRVPTLKSFQVEPQYQRKMRKIIQSINSRFKTMDCMDLDYGHFRSSFFLAKNDIGNGGEFYQEYFGRNQTLQAEIMQYGIDYKQYVKKKDKRRTQRNFELMNTKLNLNKTYSKDSKPSNRDISGSIYIDRRGSMKMGSWNPKDIKLTSSVNKKLSLVQNNHQSLITNLVQQKQKLQKTQYQMKNIVIAPNQIKSIPSISVQRVNIKSTLRNLQISRKKYPQVQGKSFQANLRQLSTGSNHNNSNNHNNKAIV